MFRKVFVQWITRVIITGLLFTGIPAAVYAEDLTHSIASFEDDYFTLDSDMKAQGYVTVMKESKAAGTYKVIVGKDEKRYVYEFKGIQQNYPLQMGDGQYQIKLYKHLGQNEYLQINEWSVEVKIKDPNSVYLGSNILIDWDENSLAAKQAKKLVTGMKSDKEKAVAIYTYIVNNMVYDDKKAAGLTAGYIPDPDSILESKEGICYDFSSVYAAMLRSVGIPAKLVMGTTTNIKGYHAWNEVLIDDKWLVVDTSYDAQAKAAGAKFTMIKANPYLAKKQF